MHRLFLLIFLTLCAAHAEPLSLAKDSTAATVTESAALTVISGQSPDRKEGGPQEKTPPIASLRIEWLNQQPAPTGFAIEPRKTPDTLSSSHHLGRTGITRTLLATEDAVFIHIVADQPGAISFKATLSSPHPGKTSPQDRNELHWEAAGDSPQRAYVRVIPFESDVEEDEGGITLRGEGECLVIFGFTPLDKPEKPLSGLWKRLAATLDPGEEHPDPVKIWQAIAASGAATSGKR